MNRRTFWMVALGLAVLAPASSSFAQERQNRGGDGGPGGGFEQFRERMMNDLKERLAASPEEWQVLQPKIEKVSAARMAMVSRGMFGRSSRGGGDRDRGSDRGGDRGPSSRVATASRELDSALENKDTPADQIAAKLAALREARAKAKAELESAQKDLKEVLTPRQEAVLVANGMLE